MIENQKNSVWLWFSHMLEVAGKVEQAHRLPVLFLNHQSYKCLDQKCALASKSEDKIKPTLLQGHIRTESEIAKMPRGTGWDLQTVFLFHFVLYHVQQWGGVLNA